MKRKNWMLYGANGYTGRLIAAEAKKQGLSPILAGRNAKSIQQIAEETGFDYRVFGLDDAQSVNKAINDCHLVLHCAGPFSVTSQPMINACLVSGVHYLDITGEISVFENAHSQSEQAMRKDVVLIPGVGFDVVPSDCLAASLVKALPSATSLVLAFETGGGPSPGTAKTGVEGLSRGGAVRQDGKMVSVPLAFKERVFPFAHGKRNAVTIPWGDVYTAYVSTGIGNIEVYMAVSPASVRKLRRLRMLKPVLGLGPVQNFLKKRIEKSVRGPSDSRRQDTQSQLWAEVCGADGRRVSATMTTPNGYDITVTASLGIVRFLMDNDVEGGYYTPSLLMGEKYAATLPGVEVRMNAEIASN
jgi:short subunit dehydrogenase-like uncharacterized protein